MITVRAELRKIENNAQLTYRMHNYEAAVRLWYARLFDYFDPKVTPLRKRVALAVVKRYQPAMKEEVRLFYKLYKQKERECKRNDRIKRRSGRYARWQLHRESPDFYAVMWEAQKRANSPDTDDICAPYVLVKKIHERDPLELPYCILVHNLVGGEVVMYGDSFGRDFQYGRLVRSKDGKEQCYAIGCIEPEAVVMLAKKAAEADTSSLPPAWRDAVKQENEQVYEQLKHMTWENYRQVMRLKKPHPRVTSAETELANGTIDPAMFERISTKYL